MGNPKFLTGTERMARAMCKELLKRRQLTRAELERAMATEAAAQKRGRKDQSRFEATDFDAALDLAASENWFIEHAGEFRLTAVGEQTAKRTRTGRHLNRFRAL